MSYNKKDETKNLMSIAQSLKEINLTLGDVRRQLSNLNIEGLVKLIDIVSDDRKNIKNIISKRELPQTKDTENIRWVLGKIYQAFRFGGFFNCEICNKNSFVIAQNGHKICDECLDKFINKGIKIEEARELYSKQKAIK